MDHSITIYKNNEVGRTEKEGDVVTNKNFTSSLAKLFFFFNYLHKMVLESLMSSS